MGVPEHELSNAAQVQTSVDSEKQTTPETKEVFSNSPNDEGFDSDKNDFQGGVKRVRAITTIWSKPMLASMFAL